MKLWIKKTIFKFQCDLMTRKINLKNEPANTKLKIFHLLGCENTVLKNQEKSKNTLRKKKFETILASHLKVSIHIIIKYAFIMH